MSKRMTILDKAEAAMKKAIKKERYLSKEDAKLINKFIQKITTELKDSEN